MKIYWSEVQMNAYLNKHQASKWKHYLHYDRMEQLTSSNVRDMFENA